MLFRNIQAQLGFMISVWFFFYFFWLSRLKLWRREMKITCRIMERKCPRFQVMETHLFMMNSTGCIAAFKKKKKKNKTTRNQHRYAASDYVSAVVNVNCRCQERVVDWECQNGKHSERMVMPQCFVFSCLIFVFNLAHTSGWHCGNGMSLLGMV